MRFHECRKKVGKGKVRIIIELDVLKSWKRKRVGWHGQRDNIDNPTEEEIAKILCNKSAHVSATLASILQSTEPAVGGKPTPTTNDINLSELVKLRAIHETLQAQNGVCNSTWAANGTEETHSVNEPSDFKQARKEIIQKFH